MIASPTNEREEEEGSMRAETASDSRLIAPSLNFSRNCSRAADPAAAVEVDDDGI